MSNLFVCVMGIGTVFFGLIALVFICMLLSFVCKFIPEKSAKKPVSKAPVAGGDIPNKGEIVAAACAAIAEELGEDVKNIKVVSFRKA